MIKMSGHVDLYLLFTKLGCSQMFYDCFQKTIIKPDFKGILKSWKMNMLENLYKKLLAGIPYQKEMDGKNWLKG